MGICNSNKNEATLSEMTFKSVTMNVDELAFITPILDSKERESLLASCGDLGADQSSKLFIKKKKNIAYVIHIHGKWFQVNQDYLIQNQSYNDFSGGHRHKRHYNMMPTQFIESKPVQKVLNEFAMRFNIPSGELILVQVESSYIDADNNYVNDDDDADDDDDDSIPNYKRALSTTGQGIHSDGSDYAMLICLERNNIRGAMNSIYHDLDGDKPLINPFVLEEGNCLFWHDNKIYHYVNPLGLSDRMKSGSRTVLTAHYPAIHHLNGTTNPNNRLDRRIMDETRKLRNL